jgi:hypothetical protein
MTLPNNLIFFKKSSADLFMALICALPLLLTLYLIKQEAILFAPLLLVATAVLFFFSVLWLLIRDDARSNGFSVPTISDYPTIQEALPLPEVPRTWSIRLIQEMEWKRFERLCLWYFLDKDVKATLVEKGTNGYIKLRLDHAKEVNAIVKHKTALKDIGVKDIKSLLVLMAKMRVNRGFYMAAGSFSAEAKVFAKENNVTLISGGMLLTMLKRLKPMAQMRLLEMATEGDYKTPTCPACNIKMVSLHGPHQDKYYWGCANKPKCKHIRPRREQRMIPRKEPRNKPNILQFAFGS